MEEPVVHFRNVTRIPPTGERRLFGGDTGHCRHDLDARPALLGQRHFRLKMPKWALNIETLNETPAPN